MPAALMDGVAVARQSLDATRDRVSAYHASSGRRPRLATVLVGDDPASHTYVRMKVNRCAQVGIDSLRRDLPADSTTEQVVGVVAELVADDGVDGILVQHPMPAQVDERAVFDAIGRGKDVDGVTAGSFSDMADGHGEGFASCTPAGIVALLDAYEVPIVRREAFVDRVEVRDLHRGSVAAGLRS